MSKPRYTDRSRYPTPYVRSDAMGENYLQRRFAEIREQQERDAAEAKAKTTPIKRRSAA